MRVMIKAWISTLIAVGILFGIPETAGAQYLTKLGYVDYFKISQEYKIAKRARNKLEEWKKEKEAELQTLYDQIQALDKELREKSFLMSATESREKGQKLSQSTAEYGEMKKAFEEELRQKNRQFGEEVFKDIDRMIREVAREQGLSMVFRQEDILYGAGDLDITNEVIKRLNEKH